MQVNVMNLGLIQRTIIQLKRFISFGVLCRYECNCLFACAYIDKGQEKFFQPKAFTLDLKMLKTNISFLNFYHTLIVFSFPKHLKSLWIPQTLSLSSLTNREEEKYPFHHFLRNRTKCCVEHNFL